jgi:hypothetical protein
MNARLKGRVKNTVASLLPKRDVTRRAINLAAGECGR